MTVRRSWCGCRLFGIRFLACFEREVVPVCGPDQQAGLPSGAAGQPGAEAPGAEMPGAAGLLVHSARLGASGVPGSSGRDPGSVTEAVRVAAQALRWLAAADVASLPIAVQAECLRELERAA